MMIECDGPRMHGGILMSTLCQPFPTLAFRKPFPDWWIVNSHDGVYPPSLSASAVDIVSWCSSWRGSDSNLQPGRKTFQDSGLPISLEIWLRSDVAKVYNTGLAAPFRQQQWMVDPNWTEPNRTSSGFLPIQLLSRSHWISCFSIKCKNSMHGHKM